MIGKIETCLHRMDCISELAKNGYAIQLLRNDILSNIFQFSGRQPTNKSIKNQVSRNRVLEPPIVFLQPRKHVGDSYHIVLFLKDGMFLGVSHSHIHTVLHQSCIWRYLETQVHIATSQRPWQKHSHLRGAEPSETHHRSNTRVNVLSISMQLNYTINWCFQRLQRAKSSGASFCNFNSGHVVSNQLSKTVAVLHKVHNPNPSKF